MRQNRHQVPSARDLITWKKQTNKSYNNHIHRRFCTIIILSKLKFSDLNYGQHCLPQFRSNDVIIWNGLGRHNKAREQKLSTRHTTRPVTHKIGRNKETKAAKFLPWRIKSTRQTKLSTVVRMVSMVTTARWGYCTSSCTATSCGTSPLLLSIRTTLLSTCSRHKIILCRIVKACIRYRWPEIKHHHHNF